MKSKIPVIYILNNGRSGSTLLELLLNTNPSVWTVGEVQKGPKPTLGVKKISQLWLRCFVQAMRFLKPDAPQGLFAG